MIEIPIADLKGDTGPIHPETVIDLRREADNVVLARYNGEEEDLGSFKGEKGDRGDDGANVIPTATAVKNEVTGATPTRQFLDQRYLLLAPAPSGGDDTAVLQDLVTKATTTGVPLYLQRGTYLTTGLVGPSGFNQPIIRGFGRNLTTLQVTGGGTAILLRGGSGQLSGGVIEDMSIEGAGGLGIGIELRGCGGVNIYRVWMKNLAIGWLLNNNGTGNFSEFNVMHDSEFATSVTLPMELRRGTGNDSFHGCGFRDVILNQGTTAPGPMIKVGAGCRLYHSPMDVTLFLRTEGVPFLLNESTQHVNTFGSIRTETSSAKVHQLFGYSSSGRWRHAGPLSSISEGVQLGTGLTLVDRYQLNSDGSVTLLETPDEVKYQLTTGANLTRAYATGGGTWMVTVDMRGPNFERTVVCLVTRFAGEATIGVVTLGTTRQFDGASIGTVTVGASGQSLAITGANFPASGFTARVTSTPLQGRLQFPLV